MHTLEDIISENVRYVINYKKFRIQYNQIINLGFSVVDKHENCNKTCTFTILLCLVIDNLDSGADPGH